MNDTALTGPFASAGPLLKPLVPSLPVTGGKPRLAKSTERSPTLSSLMQQTPDSTFKRIRVPKFTKVAHVRFEPIWLNTKKFVPGETYTVHPIVAAELLRSIENVEAVPAQQMTGRTEVMSDVLAEVIAQKKFEDEERAAAVRSALSEPAMV